MTEEYELPVPDDYAWLNLTYQEIVELRKSKKELTDYGKEKLKNLMTKQPKQEKQLTYEEMLEIAEEREKLNAGFKKDENGNWYRPTLQELEKNERIDLAIQEMRYILWGGQDGEEFGNSVKFIVDVLESLKDKEDTEFKDSADSVA